MWDAIKEIFKFLNAIFVTPKKQIKKVVAIFDTMHRILEETPVERFLVLKAHNGGGIIKPSGDLYVTVLYEDYTHPFSSIKADYQRVEVDKEYAKMLLDLLSSKKIVLQTEELENGLLKTVYQNYGIKEGIIHYLGQDKKSVYFSSAGSSKEKGWLQGADDTQLDLLVNIIKQNIK